MGLTICWRRVHRTIGRILKLIAPQIPKHVPTKNTYDRLARGIQAAIRNGIREGGDIYAARAGAICCVIIGKSRDILSPMMLMNNWTGNMLAPPPTRNFLETVTIQSMYGKYLCINIQAIIFPKAGPRHAP